MATTERPTESPYLTVAEVAARWRLKPRVVHDALSAKKLVGFKVGGQWRISPDDLERYEQSLRNVAPVRPVQTRRRSR